MNNELVSILIPVYNREELIEETVRSALAQTYQNIEIIIVDNKSIDNTWGILQKLALLDERIKIFQNESNIGPVRNWERCINEARGKYGKILWSDDLIAPTFLEKTVPFLENNKDIGFVFTKVEIFYDNSNKKLITYDIGITGIYNSDLYINEVIEIGNYPVSPGCALFRLKDLQKNLFIDIPNKLNSNFSMHAIGNDLLIFLLTASQYKKFAFLDECLSFFRVHNGSISTQSIAKLSLLYAVTKAYFIESHRISRVEHYNSYLYFLLKKHKVNNIGLSVLEDFYLNNRNTSRSAIYTLKLIYKKIKLKLKYKLKKR